MTVQEMIEQLQELESPNATITIKNLTREAVSKAGRKDRIIRVYKDNVNRDRSLVFMLAGF